MRGGGVVGGWFRNLWRNCAHCFPTCSRSAVCQSLDKLADWFLHWRLGGRGRRRWRRGAGSPTCWWRRGLWEFWGQCWPPSCKSSRPPFGIVPLRRRWRGGLEHEPASSPSSPRLDVRSAQSLTTTARSPPCTPPHPSPCTARTLTKPTRPHSRNTSW